MTTQQITTLPIDAIQIGTRHRKHLQNIEQLADSIATVGLLHPVVVKPDGSLVAGERRLAACKHLGWAAVPVRVIESVNDLYTALRAERDENTCREAFAPSEAVALAQKIEPFEREAAENRMVAAGRVGGIAKGLEKFSDPSIGRAKDRTAAAVGMSRPTLSKAEEVVEAAQEQPDIFGDLVEQMDATGKVDRAYRELQNRKREQEAAARLQQFEAAPVDDRYRLICASIEDLDTGNADLDCIITDPPYPREYLPVYADLAKFAAYALKPGGSLLVMCGQSYLPDILTLMTPHIRYHWTVAYLTPGGQAVQLWERKINTFWKPVLWFVNGEYNGAWAGDVSKSAVNDNDKRFHHWGQSESGMADLIERFTLPNEVICDPFCGGGTTGVVALQLGRRFVGADKDAKAIKATQQRLVEVCHG